MSYETPSAREKARTAERWLRWSRITHTPSGRCRRLAGLVIGVLLLPVPGASADHLVGTYNGTHSQGGVVRLTVGPLGTGGLFESPPPIVGKTDLGQECLPLFKPPGIHVAIVDHGFSDTKSEVVPGFFTYTITASGSFSALRSASGTFSITSDRWTSPSGEPTPGSTCETGTLSWSASCSNVPVPCSAPMGDGGPPPTFSGSASRARVSTHGRVTLPLRIGCPPPGVDCVVSVAGRARIPASTAVRRKRVKLGRSEYLVKVGGSSKTRFRLSTKGRRMLHRLGRIEAQLDITVTRASDVTEKSVTVRLKAPRRVS